MLAFATALALVATAVGVYTVLGGHLGAAHRAAGPAPTLSMADGGPALTGVSGVPSDQIDRRLTEMSANTGTDLEISLAWNTLTDLELEVRDPSGTRIDSYQSRTADGLKDVGANPTIRFGRGAEESPQNVMPVTPDTIGAMNAMLALDGVSGADGSAEPPPGAKRVTVRMQYTLTPVEHVFYETAPRGVYTVYVHCYFWREATRDPLPYTLQIRSRGRVFRTVSGVIGPRCFVADRVDPTIVTQFEVR